MYGVQFHCVRYLKKHSFTWLWRQNPKENYSAIFWLELIQLFPATRSGVATRSYTRSTRCTHGRLIGLNEVTKRHRCLVFRVREGNSNPIRVTHSQLSRDQVAVTWVSRVLWRQVQHLHCRSRARDPPAYYLSAYIRCLVNLPIS